MRFTLYFLASIVALIALSVLSTLLATGPLEIRIGGKRTPPTQTLERNSDSRSEVLIEQLGVLIVDVRAKGQFVSHRVIHLLRAIQRSAPDVPCELWISRDGKLPADLKAYLKTWQHLITTRQMPASHTNKNTGNMIDLTGVDGGHIGKGLALRDSAFDYPVLLDGDSWPCPGWFDRMKDTVNHADVIWSLEKCPSARIRERKATAETVSPMIAGQIAEYRKFRERNTGTVFGVRRTPATHAWLTDALDIRANQQAMLRARNNFGYDPKLPGSGAKDQSAFRESFFLHRHKVQEYLVPTDLACRSRKPTGNWCSCTCECSSCLFVHDLDQGHAYTGFAACARKYAINGTKVPNKSARKYAINGTKVPNKRVRRKRKKSKNTNTQPSRSLV